MSLWIDIDKIDQVLLADGWHEVEDFSFVVDSYEMHDGDMSVHGGGQSGICASGFGFIEEFDFNAGGAYRGDKKRICGPLSAVLAVREVP